jgi:hypothetical protein
MARRLRRPLHLVTFRLLPTSALALLATNAVVLALLATNAVVLALIWLDRVEVTPQGIDHTLDGVSDAFLYTSLALPRGAACCASLALGLRRGLAVAAGPGRWLACPGDPALLRRQRYRRRRLVLAAPARHLHSVHCYVALLAVALVAAFSLSGPRAGPSPPIEGHVSAVHAYDYL